MGHQAFVLDKNRFFRDEGVRINHHTPVDAVRSVDVKYFADTAPNLHRYDFLLENSQLIELEFKELFATLSALDNTADNQKIYWLYCYYCCKMMSAFYESYGKPDQVSEYKKLGGDIEYAFLHEFKLPAPVVRKSFLAELPNKIWSDLKAFFNPRPEYRSKVGMYNMYRIQWTFMRVTASGALSYLRGIHLLDYFEKLLHRSIHEAKFIAAIEKVTPITNILSVGFFAIKILINAGTLIKHTFVPSDKARESTVRQRLAFEAYKRMDKFMNDFAWGIINLFTNYSEFFNISAPIANGLVVGFLLFDFGLVVFQFVFKWREYRSKLAQYREELSGIDARLSVWQPDEERVADLAARALLDAQIKEHELKWKVQRDTYAFNALAAMVFLGAYTVSVLFSGPLIGIVSYFFCVVAVAIYLSEGAFEKYDEAKRRENILKQLLDVTVNQLSAAHHARSVARNDLIISLINKTVIPTLMIALLAICWEAAVIVAVAYLIFELGLSWYRHPKVPPANLANQVNEAIPSNLANEPVAPLVNDVVPVEPPANDTAPAQSVGQALSTKGVVATGSSAATPGIGFYQPTKPSAPPEVKSGNDPSFTPAGYSPEESSLNGSLPKAGAI